jgi:hypothetical protein
MEQVLIYGFGSYFNSGCEFNDIDILILHSDVSYDCCHFSLLCKRNILSRFSNLDVTILSKAGESQFNFIEKSNAIFLGKVAENSLSNDLESIISRINYR